MGMVDSMAMEISIMFVMAAILGSIIDKQVVLPFFIYSEFMTTVIMIRIIQFFLELLGYLAVFPVTTICSPKLHQPKSEYVKGIG